MNTTTPADVAHLASLSLVDVRTLAKLLDISRRQCWRLSALADAGRGSFPRPLRLGDKTVRWKVSDVERYLAALAGEPKP